MAVTETSLAMDGGPDTTLHTAHLSAHHPRLYSTRWTGSLLHSCAESRRVSVVLQTLSTRPFTCAQ